MGVPSQVMGHRLDTSKVFGEHRSVSNGTSSGYLKCNWGTPLGFKWDIVWMGVQSQACTYGCTVTGLYLWVYSHRPVPVDIMWDIVCIPDRNMHRRYAIEALLSQVCYRRYAIAGRCAIPGMLSKVCYRMYAITCMLSQVCYHSFAMDIPGMLSQVCYRRYAITVVLSQVCYCR